MTAGARAPMDSVARSTVINLATRTLALLAVLAVTALVARQGTAVQGMFALFTSVEALLLALFSGFGVALARRVSHHREDVRGWLAAMLLGCIALGLVSSMLLLALSFSGPPGYGMLWLLAIAAPLLLVTPNVAGLWLGEGRMGPMALATLAAPVVTLVLLVALTLAGSAGLTPVLAAWVGAKSLVAIVLVAQLKRRGRLAPPDWPAWRAEFAFVVAIGLTNLISLANYRVGLFMVERLLGLSATGVYSIAVVIAELLWFVSSSLTQAAYSRIGNADRAQAAAVTLRVLQLGLLALLLAAPLLWAAAAIAVPLLLGAEYAASVALLALLLPGVLVFGGASSLSAYFTNHAGTPRVPARVALFSLLLNAALCLVLVPRWGMAGAALAASLAYLASAIVLAQRFAAHAGLPLAALVRPGPQLGRDLGALASRLGGR